MSLITVSFNLSAIPVVYQTAFLERVCQLNLEYQALTAPVPPSPPAETLPMPTSFIAMDGDDAAVPAPEPAAEKPKKERKNPWAALTEEQRADRLAKLAAGREAKKARKMSADSVDAPAPAPATLPVVEADAASESSSKKARKNPWADMTPEQKAERIAKMQAARVAKKAAKAAAADGSA
jgi:hypothetical protein